MTSESESVEMVTCPAGVCQKQIAIVDYDRLFGHLLVDHHWTFWTAQDKVNELMG